MVLALFKRTDRGTLDAACEGLKRRRAAQRGGGAPRRLLVATHADRWIGDVTDGELRRAAEDGGADGVLKINALAEDGAGDVERLLHDAGPWSGASRVVESGIAGAVESALDSS